MVEHIKLSSFDKALAFSPFTLFPVVGAVVGVVTGEGSAKGKACRPRWWQHAYSSHKLYAVGYGPGIEYDLRIIIFFV
jgi:hypothetical protein